MVHKLILLLVLTVGLFFFSGGAFLAEGTLSGASGSTCHVGVGIYWGELPPVAQLRGL